jgi:hypothetical protein
MASLREDFGYFYAPDDDAVAAALRTGLVSADTNVLLSLYRFQPRAREDLFGALEIIGDRLWIPHQVALEFHRKRLSVITGQESYFSKTAAELDSAMKEYLSRLRAFINRIALPSSQSGELEERIQKAHEAVIDKVSSAGQANEIHLDNRDSDEVLRRLEKLFSNRVGEPMKPDELEVTRKEAKRRVDAKIPPGYMDKNKVDPSGDYILWKQLMKEAGKRKLPVTLITDDRKEDWFWREHGQTIGPRYELREEMQSEAGVPFLMMTIETFLIQARKYLKASVSPATVGQAKELRDILELEQLRVMEVNLRAELADLMAVHANVREHSEVLKEQAAAMRHEFLDWTSEHGGSRVEQFRERLHDTQNQLDACLRRRDSIEAEIARVQDALRVLEDDLTRLAQ